MEAVDICSAKGPGWRLPELLEFFTLVDYTNFLPALPTGHPFDVVRPDHQFWSGTIQASDLSRRWTFILDEGRTFEGPAIGGSGRVWCVNGSFID
jgi:hypothetical protein